MEGTTVSDFTELPKIPKECFDFLEFIRARADALCGANVFYVPARRQGRTLTRGLNTSDTQPQSASQAPASDTPPQTRTD